MTEVSGVNTGDQLAVPDPSAETDGKVLTTASGAAGWAAPTGGAPSGAAGGVLSGTYPDPGFAADMATQAELDAVAAAAQPLDADLSDIAGLDSSTAGAIGSDGAGWIKKTYAQFKTALALVKADVGLGSVDNTADSAKPVSTAQQTAIDAKVTANAGITGATKTKITYDAKGLVTAGADATTADVADSLNKRYVTDAELTVLGNTSGTNSGDQTSVSGNAGTATKLAATKNIDGQAFDGSADITVIAPGTHAATGKTTPADADELPLVDSAASNVLKKVTWANLKATLKTYFDTLYPSGSGTSTGTNTGDTAEYVGGGGDIAINDTNYVTICTQNITLAAGDSVIVEADFLILNNSGGTRTYTYALAVGAFVVETVDGTTHAASATSRAYEEFRGSAEVRSTSLAYGGSRVNHQTPSAANTSASAVLTQMRMTWNTSGSDFTGSQAVALKIKSSATNATQTLTLLGYRIRKV